MDLKELTWGENISISNEILTDKGWRFKSFKPLGIKFLSIFLDIDLYKEDFKMVLESYINNSEDSKAPETEYEFYEYICEKYLSIIKLPYDLIIDLYEEARNDIEEIENTLKKLSDERKSLEIKNKTGDSTAEDRYRYHLVNHYYKMNEIAKNEIHDYIYKELPFEAIKKSKKKSYLMPTFFPEKPYRYNKDNYIRMINYDIEQFSEIMNKFGELSVQDYFDVQGKYITKEIDLTVYMKEYIHCFSIVQKLKEVIDKNHIIFNKKNIADYIIEAYQQKDFLAFINLVPLHIEGIFNDICISLGASNKELSMSSLNTKLDIIQKKLKSYIDYEYFSFHFPLIRNQIAHGDLITTNKEKLAHHLLLDLYSIYEFTCNDELIYNKNIKQINEFNSLSTQDKKFNYIVDNPNFIKLNIPSFYEEYKILNEIKISLEHNDFWNFIDKQFNNPNDLYSKKILKFVALLKKMEISIEKCKNFFNSISTK